MKQAMFYLHSGHAIINPCGVFSSVVCVSMCSASPAMGYGEREIKPPISE